MYGKHGEVKGTRGLVHDYLGMKFIFGDGDVKIDMVEYVQQMLNDFPVKFNKKDLNVMTPAGIDLFKEDVSKKLNKKE